MKKLFYLLLFLTISSLSFSQIEKGKMRLMLGYGLPNIPAQILNDVSTSSGPIEIGYKYACSDALSIGFMYNNSSAKTSDVLFDDGLGNSYSYNFGVGFNTFLTQLDYSWLRRDTYNFYSGLSLGYVVVSAETNIISGSPSDDLKFSAASNAAAYHLTFVGISSRLIKGLGVYSELGYGYNGIFNAGLSYTF